MTATEDGRRKILFVDDEPMVLLSIERMLRDMKEFWEMLFVADPRDAARIVADSRFDAVVADRNMGSVSGIAILESARVKSPSTACLLFSGQGPIPSELTGRFGFLGKPCTREELIDAVRARLSARPAEVAA